jgi:type I restriction enzyme R subunit
LCSLIHKFGNKEEADYDSYLEELKNSLPKDFKPKGDFYVFVDECHRSTEWRFEQSNAYKF